MATTAKHATGAEEERENGDAKRRCLALPTTADDAVAAISEQMRLTMCRLDSIKAATDAKNKHIHDLEEELYNLRQATQQLSDTVAKIKRALLVFREVDEADDCHVVLIEEDAAFFPDSFDAIWGRVKDVEACDTDPNAQHMAVLLHWPTKKNSEWPSDRAERCVAIKHRLAECAFLPLEWFSADEYDNSALHNNGTPYRVWHVRLGEV